MMDKTRFLALLETYGAAIDRWPDAVRVSARLFLETADEDVTARMAEELAFDAFLAPARGPAEVSISLEERLLSTAPSPAASRTRNARRAGFLAWSTPRWVSALLVGGCLAGGAGAGYASTTAEVRNLAAEDMMYYASSGAGDLIDVIDQEVAQ